MTLPAPTVGFFDATGPDNFIALEAATREGSLLDVRLVFISGRAAHSDRRASTEERDDVYSAQIHLLNTKRMTGYLARAGRTTSVYQGEEVFRTQLRTVISHARHANEIDYDLEGDWHKTQILGDFVAGLAALRRIIAGLKPGEKLTVLVGGPCTELAIILRYCPDIAAHIGHVYIQAGDFAGDGSSELKGGPGNSFNGAVDSAALCDLLYLHKGEATILPSNKTKQRELAMSVDEIVRFTRPEMGRIYRVHAAIRGGNNYIHDLGLVMLAEQDIRGESDSPYRTEPVRILGVPTCKEYMGSFEDEVQIDRRGTILIEPATNSNRHVVVWQDTAGYRKRVASLLAS